MEWHSYFLKRSYEYLASDTETVRQIHGVCVWLRVRETEKEIRGNTYCWMSHLAIIEGYLGITITECHNLTRSSALGFWTQRNIYHIPLCSYQPTVMLSAQHHFKTSCAGGKKNMSLSLSFGFKHLWRMWACLGNMQEMMNPFDRNNHNNNLVIYILPFNFTLSPFCPAMCLQSPGAEGDSYSVELWTSDFRQTALI